MLAKLAEMQMRIGRLEDASGCIATAIDPARQARQLFYVAELWRLRAEIVLLRDPVHDDAVQSMFMEAIRIARGQDARTFELRAATSLARLLRDRGRGGEARALLPSVYAWFTEGFETADLKDAKALLEDLA